MKPSASTAWTPAPITCTSTGSPAPINYYGLRIIGPDLPADFLEPNNSMATATDLGRVSGERNVDGLSIHSQSDRDWFRFETLQGSTAGHMVETLFTHADGDVDMRLFDADGLLLDSSSSTTDNESISLNGLPAGIYHLEVFGFIGAANTYRLRLTTPPPMADNWETNDTAATASDLRIVAGFRQINFLSIHSATDSDWFRFRMDNAATADHRIELSFTHANGDIDAALYSDPAGGAIRFGVSASDNELISLDGLAAGTYYLRVYGFAGHVNEYNLRITAPELTPDRFEPNNTMATAAELGTLADVRFENNLNIQSNTDADYFRLHLAEPGDAASQIEVLFSHALGDIDARLYNASGQIVGSGTSVTDNEVFDLNGLPAGTYFLHVFGFAGAANYYHLRFNSPAVQPDHYEVNNTPLDATDLGTLTATRDEPGLNIHSGSDSDWFRFTLAQAPATGAEIRVLFEHANGDIDAALYLDPAGNPIRTGTSTNNNETLSLAGLAAGTYYLRVYGFAGAINYYDLRILLQAPAIPGDANGDGRVDGEDFLIWQANFGIASGATTAMGDFNGDGRVDGEDFLIWQANFGTVAAASPAPDPAPSMVENGVLTPDPQPAHPTAEPARNGRPARALAMPAGPAGPENRSRARGLFAFGRIQDPFLAQQAMDENPNPIIVNKMHSI